MKFKLLIDNEEYGFERVRKENIKKEIFDYFNEPFFGLEKLLKDDNFYYFALLKEKEPLAYGAFNKYNREFLDLSMEKTNKEAIWLRYGYVLEQHRKKGYSSIIFESLIYVAEKVINDCELFGISLTGKGISNKGKLRKINKSQKKMVEKRNFNNIGYSKSSYGPIFICKKQEISPTHQIKIMEAQK